jgi:hypothetical protein
VTEIIAALTLARYPLHAVYGALVRMGLNRHWLRRTPGLRFWKLLGTAREPAFGGWEPRRYALFTVWESTAALDTFEARSPVMTAYRRSAAELWSARLAPVAWHGAWGGADPFAGARAAASASSNRWAVLTRATIRPRHMRTFRAAAAPVGARLIDQPGLLAMIGLGEAPFLYQATFSVWTEPRFFQEFAYRDAEHATVIRRTRAEGWYSEELFARFRLLTAYGTWDGRDPLQRR